MLWEAGSGGEGGGGGRGSEAGNVLDAVGVGKSKGIADMHL